MEHIQVSLQVGLWSVFHYLPSQLREPNVILDNLPIP
jgi:hypothetical protein